MTEFRRLKMKIGEAEFEADVPENEVHPITLLVEKVVDRRRVGFADFIQLGRNP